MTAAVAIFEEQVDPKAVRGGNARHTVAPGGTQPLLVLPAEHETTIARRKPRVRHAGGDGHTCERAGTGSAGARHDREQSAREKPNDLRCRPGAHGYLREWSRRARPDPARRASCSR